jgi:hypothetical protein
MPLHRLLTLVVVASLGCTSVKIVQRVGCWLRQTERTIGGSSEEIGFCARPQPVWAQDRLSRLAQECMAQADYRWQNRALAAWSRGQPVPAQDSEDATAKACIAEASSALRVEAEREALKSRLAEVSKDLDALREQVRADQKFLQQSNEKMASALGEAAKKVPPNAVATATSTGTGSAKSDPGQPPPAPTVVGITGAPATPVIVTPGAPGAAPRVTSGTAAKTAGPCVPAPRKTGARAPADEKDAPPCVQKAQPDPKSAAELVGQPHTPASAGH